MPADAATLPARPAGMFDRETEWDALVRFTGDPAPGPALGVVSGRRRQGKSFLLEALTRATGGFYYDVQEMVEAESLHRLADRYAAYTGGPAPHWTGWQQAIDALLALGDGRPRTVVIDDFPHLVRQSPVLPSVLHQTALRLGGEHSANRLRLLVSGPTTTVLRRLFHGPAPLHGLVRLELEVKPFGFRRAARFWGIEDPRLAVQTHTVVGGTPAYRRDYVCDDAPAGPDDFDAWVCRTALNPRVPLFWESRRLLEEETDHADRVLCHSVLAAIATGRTTRGEIAESLALGSVPAVSRALALLQDCELLVPEPDAFRQGLNHYGITEPLLAFEHAIAWPHHSALEHESAPEHQDRAALWQRLRPVFDTALAAPHFARLCRQWALDHAAPDTFGARPASAAAGEDAQVVLRGTVDGRPGVLLSVGRTNWTDPMDTGDLDRLRRLLDRLAAEGEDTRAARPACYGAAGFTPGLRAAEAAGEVVLVDPERLYNGE
ncbi:AAA family ATPase [Streptomyces orinoci]|uniref:ArsR family transcriptional regulator n=1 Tax=Streptomyces orinoci TaxID=67339 RepID=A0ABV3K7B5_STRON|nr:ArsR family transcriptional regulator [Streptomyces orinoci]